VPELCSTEFLHIFFGGRTTIQYLGSGLTNTFVRPPGGIVGPLMMQGRLPGARICSAEKTPKAWVRFSCRWCGVGFARAPPPLDDLADALNNENRRTSNFSQRTYSAASQDWRGRWPLLALVPGLVPLSRLIHYSVSSMTAHTTALLSGSFAAADLPTGAPPMLRRRMPLAYLSK